MEDNLYFKSTKPGEFLDDFIESFWMLENRSKRDKEVFILPDGRIDLTFFQSASHPFRAILSGVETRADQAILRAGTRMFAISFKLLAIEYILANPVSDFLDSALVLPNGFWEFAPGDLEDFQLFTKKAKEKVLTLLPNEIDQRKQRLFDLIYSSNGTITVKELSEKVSWSSRQINRYFNEQFGLSLKAYCNILRFRASFQHIKEGKLFPENNFADQSHFIKEVKKLSGVSPKELKKNLNDRFIQFSTLAAK
ncbi:helix-turn-helix domain-containing protein [Desertivirga arenae]|uniref:helix-turn-helix domain-containing protein n=1 Tax=Desertivirga arenae TaxID=2810309 RepID=UPI001A97770D|nr:AraC family transcriptional regulator [Pedobacter sp. SYSU D00823]